MILVKCLGLQRRSHSSRSVANDARLSNAMKSLTYHIASSLLLLPLIGQSLLGQQVNNQVLQAYVLQNENLAQVEKKLSAKAQVMIDASRELLNLDEAQLSTVSLACRGDIARFMQDLTELDLHTQDIDMQNLGQNQELMQRIWPILMPARQKIEQGLHGEHSLFYKTLDSLLSQEQKEIYEQHQQQKLLRQTLAISRLTLAEFEKKMPLSKKQRDRIIELIEQSPKPKKIEQSMSYYLGIIILAKLPVAEMSEILTEDQLKQFQRFTRNGAQFGGVVW